MKLAEALKLVQTKVPPGARPFEVGLVCGCTAQHLQVFLTAHLRTQLPDRQITVRTGLYGDCLGNLERLGQTTRDGLALVIEWSDLDPRLGLRHSGGWSPKKWSDILASVDAQARRFEDALTRVAAHAPVALCLPTLPLPPVACTPGWQLSDFELQLQSRLWALAAEVVRRTNVRLVNPQRLDALSPSSERLDVRTDLLSGFPYRTPHASIIAELLARLLHHPPSKKGIITDLDDTLWRGLLGEVGVDCVSWSLDRNSQSHALYQQLLQSLAESGVLVAVASKNDPARVEEAFRREDLLLQRDRVFPVEAHWGPKSESVGRILQAWNIGADSVVFIDDSPLELAEVKAAHPGIETIPFPREQDQAIYELLVRLRDLFGKEAVREEDGLRLDSLRRAAEVTGTGTDGGTDRDAFLQGLEAELVLCTTRENPDPRALELVTKTNQFNLNGRRYTEGEWQTSLKESETFLYLVSYQDRFGPLGKIAVLRGRRTREELRVETWVMSCRAFSRRIEHRCVELLFDHFGVEEIVFDFEPTARNGPLLEFFGEITGAINPGPLRLRKADFTRNCPALFHQVKVVGHGQDPATADELLRGGLSRSRTGGDSPCVDGVGRELGLDGDDHPVDGDRGGVRAPVPA
jgi:FkbH-like protein